jgi:hypothetical protein
MKVTDWLMRNDEEGVWIKVKEGHNERMVNLDFEKAEEFATDILFQVMEKNKNE